MRVRKISAPSRQGAHTNSRSEDSGAQEGPGWRRTNRARLGSTQLQVPTSWRAVIQDGQTLQLLFDYYKNTTPPNSALAIEAIILMSSVRRSIFPGEKARSAFLALLISNARDILANQIGLQHQVRETASAAASSPASA
eukprot:scaffold2724_cov260-Pinguiococcus_pyrenoidosus.AAC.26